jgi:hypothetical protein
MAMFGTWTLGVGGLVERGFFVGILAWYVVVGWRLAGDGETLHNATPKPLGTDPHQQLVAHAHRFAAFCTSDVVRYQLLLQHLIPPFSPSPESYAPAVRALDAARQRLEQAGVRDSRHLDTWTALMTGLVDQQISNDPGGDRWIRLIDDVVVMFLAHCVNEHSSG